MSSNFFSLTNQECLESLWQALLSQLGGVKSIPKCRARPGRKWEHEPYEMVILVYFEPRTIWILYAGDYIIARSRVYGCMVGTQWTSYTLGVWLKGGSIETNVKRFLLWFVDQRLLMLHLASGSPSTHNQPTNAATNTIPTYTWYFGDC